MSRWWYLLCSLLPFSVWAQVPPVQSCPAASTYVAQPPAFLTGLDPFLLLAGAPSKCMAAGSTTSPCAPHRVYVPNAAVPVREPLVVFLPGTEMEPGKHDLVLRTAAFAGYRTIGLSYDNGTSVASACAAFPNCGSNCRGLVRQEAILGNNVSPQVNVLPGDSVLERLYRALAALDATFPADGWGSYYVPTAGNITPSHIVWSNIIFSGFSQGAGHAAMISRLRAVHGLVILDGANDTCFDPAQGTDVPAEWITMSADQSAGRPKYGVSHSHGMAPYVISPAWIALGIGTTDSTLDDPITDITDTNPPRHITWTAQGHPAFPAICSDHMSMARDQCLPTNFSGAPAANTVPDNRLFGPYLRRFCYACDAATCP